MVAKQLRSWKRDATSFIAHTVSMEFRSDMTARLDAVLADKLETRSLAQKLIKSKEVSVNGTIVTKPSFTIEADDLIVVHADLTVPLSRSADSQVTPVTLDLPVLYEDQDCLVINKPAGISVHPGHSSEPDEVTVLHGLSALFAEKSLTFVQGAVLVHRLDKETSGCLLIAKNPSAHRLLQQQFKDRLVEKYYLALVFGQPEHTTAVIEAPIGRHTGDRTKMAVIQSANSRDARTGYEVLASAEGVSLLRCRLYTGRTHQIRVHLQSIGHPLLGDSKYCSPDTEQLTTTAKLQRLWLHAEKLSFTALTGKEVTVSAVLPDDLVTTLTYFGLTAPAR